MQVERDNPLSADRYPRRKPLTALLYFLAWAMPIKWLVARQLAKPAQISTAYDEEKFDPRLTVHTRHSEAGRAVTISPQQAQGRDAAHIIYLHGGGHAMKAIAAHRHFGETLALRTSSQVSFLEFPLPPKATCIQTLDEVMKLYRMLVQLYPYQRLILMGDSAGGGLAISLLQQLQKDGKKRGETLKLPDQTVLFSPWLDIRLTHVKAQHIRREAFLPLAALKIAGRRYAGHLCDTDSRCSPLYGAHAQLGAVQIFVSRDELFFPDCLLFAQQAQTKSGTHIQLIIEPRRLHCWPILPPAFEQEQNIQKIADFCRLPLTK